MLDPYARNEIHFEFILNDKSHRHSLKLSPLAVRELTQSVELSDEPLSVLFASMSNGGITERTRILQYRRAFAEEIAAQIAKEIVKALGSNDRQDGYLTHDN